MNFNVYLDDELGQKLESICHLTGKKRNTIIREALEVWLSQYSIAQWPSSIQKFQGDSQMVPFESYRAELHEPTDRNIF